MLLESIIPEIISMQSPDIFFQHSSLYVQRHLGQSAAESVTARNSPDAK